MCQEVRDLMIMRGIEKGIIFRDDYDRKGFVSRMGELAKSSGPVIYAYALLSNHVHILLMVCHYLSYLGSWVIPPT